jgi:hypothetical protein
MDENLADDSGEDPESFGQNQINTIIKSSDILTILQEGRSKHAFNR